VYNIIILDSHLLQSSTHLKFQGSIHMLPFYRCIALLRYVAITSFQVLISGWVNQLSDESIAASYTRSFDYESYARSNCTITAQWAQVTRVDSNPDLFYSLHNGALNIETRLVKTPINLINRQFPWRMRSPHSTVVWGHQYSL